MMRFWVEKTDLAGPCTIGNVTSNLGARGGKNACLKFCLFVPFYSVLSLESITCIRVTPRQIPKCNVFIYRKEREEKRRIGKV